MEMVTALLMIASNAGDMAVENAEPALRLTAPTMENCLRIAEEQNRYAVQAGEETYYFCVEE